MTTPASAALQLGAASIGVLSTTQAAINSVLGSSLAAPVAAALFSYSVSASLVLLACAALARAAGVGLLAFTRAPRWFELCGGACGASFLLCSVFAAPRLGVALFFSLAVAGQLASSLAIDALGCLDFRAVPVSRAKAACVLGALLGALLSSLEEVGPRAIVEGAAAAAASADAGVAPSLWLLPLVVVGGALQPLQAAINTRLATLLPHKVQAAAVSLLVSTCICAVLLLLLPVLGAAPPLGVVAERFASHAAPWMALGGVCIATVVVGGVFLPVRLGTAVYFTWYLVGELLVSLIFDAVGAFGIAVRPPTATRMLAVALVLAAALAQSALSSGGAAATATTAAATAESGKAVAAISPSAAQGGGSSARAAVVPLPDAVDVRSV